MSLSTALQSRVADEAAGGAVVRSDGYRRRLQHQKRREGTAIVRADPVLSVREGPRLRPDHLHRLQSESVHRRGSALTEAAQRCGYPPAWLLNTSGKRHRRPPTGP